MEPTDMLSSLLSDPQKLQSAISMASSLFGGGAENSAPAAAPSEADDAEAAMPVSAPSLPSPPAFGAGGFGAAPAGGFDPSMELVSRAMPVINAIARSGQTAISREKANLLQSIKPFVASDVGAQIDHAMKLVSMARMARSAMGQLGGATRSGDGTGNA